MTIESMKKILAMPSIGNFKCIELFEVIGKKDNNPSFNIFSLAVAHEADLLLTEEEKITPNLIKLKADKSLKFGVFKRIVSIEDFLNIISYLVTPGSNEDDGNKLCYGYLKAIPPVYVPPLEQGKNEFLGLLKNNFFGGSHLFEWFDESKEYVAPLIKNLAALDELSGRLQEYLPIKIGTHSDRLGNIIVQIPCAAVTFTIERKDKQSHQLLSNLAVSPHFSGEINFSGIFWREQHGSIIDYQKIPLVVGENIIPFQQINGSGYYAIWDESKQIICSGGQVRSFVESVNFSMNLQEYNQRIFKLPNGKEKRINIFTPTSQSQIGKNTKDYRNWVRNRFLKIEKQELHDTLKLRQFKRDMRQEALDFIRELIKKYGENGIYLWDPYLNAKDLFETVFFSPYANSPIKALTGLKIAPQENKTSSYKADLANEINQAIRQAGWLNLIFVNADRSKVGDFHDRFIIFPQAIDEPVRAWSLGTSVNSLGKSHHIIQEVEDGQIIADAFEEMWKQSICNESNILWTSKNN
ncbi:VPA1262 family N-terminal domain-containing protein [Neisseria mucosa]|uniref:VPA1262 family N-terminal domain-containing protein n=1 Tax=Neisseria mucosa TaxID=488 RepID=UPI00280A5653|nr:VPA1262 family N-terminal domain-containing protein [Neisseria mucosa]